MSGQRIITETKDGKVQERYAKGGQYAEKASAPQAPGVELDGSGEAVEWQPPKVGATINLQRWENDYAVEVGAAQFDVERVLDSYSLEDLDRIEGQKLGRHDTGFDASYEGDELYFAAVRMGLAEEHNGPFSVYVDQEQLEDYMERRREAELADPVTPAPVFSREQAERDSAEAMNDLLGGRNLAEVMDWSGDDEAEAWKREALERYDNEIYESFGWQDAEHEIPADDRAAVDALRAAEGERAIRKAAWGIADRFVARAVDEEYR